MSVQDYCVVVDPVILSASTALGHLAVAVHEGALIGVTFGYRSDRAAELALRRRLPSCPSGAGGARRALKQNPWNDGEELAADVVDQLVRYADGEAVDFTDIPVASDHLTPFARRVAKACRAIRRGETRTYGDLARAAGAPGAARAVGHVMATNRTPLVIPCHRVVASGGGLGGFSAPDGLAMKRRLLELEACPLFR